MHPSQKHLIVLRFSSELMEVSALVRRIHPSSPQYQLTMAFIGTITPFICSRACNVAIATFPKHKRFDRGSDLFHAIRFGQEDKVPMPLDQVVRMKRGGEEESNAPAAEFVRQFVSAAPGADTGGHVQHNDVDVPGLRCAQGS